ncbi:MAG TPA: tripartite tricarboxylate transporter TctB family protein [Burkholderiales bacterium]|nr:tripartite tricarboxylate transporter TctB family protein [Burkholderiales bacterium]
MKLSKDGWGGLAVLAASLFLFALTLGLKDNPLVPIGPGYYPRIVLAVTAAFALALIAMDFVAPSRPARAAEKLNYVLVLEMFAVFGLYVGALPYLGFRVSTFVYVAATNALLDVPRSVKGCARVLLIALITTVAVYYVFERYLTVLLPRGRWTDF